MSVVAFFSRWLFPSVCTPLLMGLTVATILLSRRVLFLDTIAAVAQEVAALLDDSEDELCRITNSATSSSYGVRGRGQHVTQRTLDMVASLIATLNNSQLTLQSKITEIEQHLPVLKGKQATAHTPPCDDATEGQDASTGTVQILGGFKVPAAVMHHLLYFPTAWSAALTLSHDRLIYLRDRMYTCGLGAQQLQEDLDQAMAEHLDSAGTSVQPQQHAFDCPICMEVLGVEDIFVVGSCNHCFCRGCAVQAITEDINQQVATVCPICKASPCPLCPCNDRSAAGPSSQPRAGDIAAGPQDDRDCFCIISQQDLQVVLHNDLYARYLQSEANQAMRMGLFMRCPRNECGEGVEMPEGQVHFRCPTCRYEFCTACGVPWHANSTCEQYQTWQAENARADTAFQELHRQMGSKSCPGCRHAATKENPASCNKVTCGNCRIYFCWVCGQRITGYEHFSTQTSPCYNKLFEGVPGH